MARIFISYTQKEPDSLLAMKFHDKLLKNKHSVFLDKKSLSWGENWEERIMEELDQCDYFLVLLSAHSLESDMVAGEIRRAKELADTRDSRKPVLLPLRVNLPFHSTMNYELASYLHRIQQIEWKSEADTPKILENLLKLVDEGGEPPLLEESDLLVNPPDPIGPPLASAPLEVPGGTVGLASPYYVKRSIDQRCYTEILKPGTLLRIKAPRQFGKTSLSSRLLEYAKQNSYGVISLNFQQFGKQSITDLPTLVRQICSYASRKLSLPNRIKEYWDEFLSPILQCTNYFEEYLLPESRKPIVLALDEADLLFEEEEILSDFSGMLRSWHEEGKINPTWEQLRLVVVHSTEAYLAISKFQSPLANVGEAIVLDEFNEHEVEDLAHRHNLAWERDETERLMAMIGGHPFLVRRALYDIAQGNITLEKFVEAAPKDDGPFGDHLRRHLWNLRQYPQLAQAMKQIVQNNHCADSLLCFKLNAAGLICGEVPNSRPRFELYRRYFMNRQL